MVCFIEFTITIYCFLKWGPPKSPWASNRFNTKSSSNVIYFPWMIEGVSMTVHDTPAVDLDCEASSAALGQRSLQLVSGMALHSLGRNMTAPQILIAQMFGKCGRP